MFVSANAVAFIGERTSPGGRRRLIIIPYGRLNALDSISMLKTSWIFETTGFLGGAPKNVGPQRAYQYSGRAVPMQLKPGVADPADACPDLMRLVRLNAVWL